MRKKTDKEKEIMGQVEEVLRWLQINKDSAGYMPLLDSIVYAYAFPDEGLTDIIDMLSRENYYLGLHDENSNVDARDAIYSKIVSTVKSAIEAGDRQYMMYLQLDRLKVILQGKRGKELEDLLLTELGDKYRQYSNDEKIVLFFIKKILKAVKNEV